MRSYKIIAHLTLVAGITVLSACGGSSPQVESPALSSPSPIPTAPPNPTANRTPTAQFTYHIEGTQLLLDATSSSDPDGDALTFSWDMGDDQDWSTSNPEIAYDATQSYRIVLSVSDGEFSASKTTIIDASAMPLGDKESGAELYAQQCVVCHGADGQNAAFKAIDSTLLEYQHSQSNTAQDIVSYLNDWMPMASPSMCEGVCAADIAAYIRSWNDTPISTPSPSAVPTPSSTPTTSPNPSPTPSSTPSSTPSPGGSPTPGFTPSPTPTQSPTQSPSPAPIIGDVQRGQELFESQEQFCSACHGNDGQLADPKIDEQKTVFTHIDEPNQNFTLETYIVRWMPKGNTDKCEEQCAADIASYIRSWSPIQITDTDSDGIEDSTDICPNTPANETSNIAQSGTFIGCSPSERDTDNDGINDSLDDCPAQSGPQSNTGCPVAGDDDSDGIANTEDLCADTALDAISDTEGCSSFQRGAKLYVSNLQCSTCHGVTGEGASADVISGGRCDKVNCRDIDALTDYISEEMPFSAKDSCQGQCAEDLADYIVNAFNRSGSTGDSDGDGITDSDDQCPNTALAQIASIDATGCAQTHEGSSLVFALNAAGAAFTSTDGIAYIADSANYYSQSSQSQSPKTDAISNTDNDLLYQTERFATAGAEFEYKVLIDNDRYRLTLHFAEVFHTTANVRVFSVDVEGQELISNLDLIAASGARYTAHDVVLDNVQVTDNTLNIRLRSQVNNAQITGFKIEKIGNDGDSDGIIDNLDRCPGSATGNTDNQGCSPAQLDKDGDGVDLYNDLCPDTPSTQSSTVQSTGELAGCSEEERAVDLDQDGISDVIDQCPGVGGKVGASGCALDSNLPSTADILDAIHNKGVLYNAYSPSIRLNDFEYINTIKQAYNIQNLTLYELPTDSQYGPFTLNAKDNLGDYFSYLDIANKFATEIAPVLYSRCDWQTNLQTCITQHFVPAMQQAFKKPITAEDSQTVSKTISNALTRGTSMSEALVFGVQATLVDPRFIYRFESGTSDTGEPNWRNLSDEELASRLSYFLVDAPADSELLQAVKAGNINSQIDRLLLDTRSRGAMRQFVAEWLKIPYSFGNEAIQNNQPLPTDQCNLTADCRTLFPGFTTYDCQNSSSNTSTCSCDGQACSNEPFFTLNDAMIEETKLLIDHIVNDEQGNLGELFTANYSYLNAELAAHYGLPAPTNNWEQSNLPSSSQRAGILTHASLLSRTGQHDPSLSWIFRGKFVYEHLLCEKLDPPPPDAIDLADQIDNRETQAPCSGCHATIDPIGRIFDGYDEFGQLRENAMDSGALFTQSDIDGHYPSPIALGQAIAVSDTLNFCATKMLFRYALGREPVQSDTESFNATMQSLESTGSIREAVKTFAQSNAFKTVHMEQALMCPVPAGVSQ